MSLTGTVLRLAATLGDPCENHPHPLSPVQELQCVLLHMVTTPGVGFGSQRWTGTQAMKQLMTWDGFRWQVP